MMYVITDWGLTMLGNIIFHYFYIICIVPKILQYLHSKNIEFTDMYLAFYNWLYIADLHSTFWFNILLTSCNPS